MYKIYYVNSNGDRVLLRREIPTKQQAEQIVSVEFKDIRVGYIEVRK